MDMRQLRLNVGIKTLDVANYVGIAESTVRNWEYGKTIPKLRLDQMKKLLDIYGCNFDELYNAVQESSRLKK